MNNLIDIRIDKSEFIKYVINQSQSEDGLFLHESTIEFIGDITATDSAILTDYITMDNEDELYWLITMYLNDTFPIQLNLNARMGENIRIQIDVAQKFFVIRFRRGEKR